MNAPATLARAALAAALGLAVPAVATAAADEPDPSIRHAQSESSLSYAVTADGATVDIVNVTFAVTGSYLPGRPADERLVLRTSVRSRQVIDEVGTDSTVTVEAWPLGADLAGEPAYAIALDGLGARTVDGSILVFDRGTEEVEWWSVYALGTGSFLFDTHVPVASFSISRGVQTLRYAGLEVPPDDATDARLREPHVLGVLTYAAADAVRREVLITCDDGERAALLRSYWDGTRSLSAEDTGPSSAPDAEATASPEGMPRPLALTLVWAPNDPRDGQSVRVVVPIADDDLDLAHATLPPGLHMAAWRR
ncbi:MAG: hypothetical protein IRY94_18880 [Rhodospirillaceae bacterium]|nr:hypothetical protein [Rhodospirillaceae bacterium]